MKQRPAFSPPPGARPARDGGRPVAPSFVMLCTGVGAAHVEEE